MKSWNAFRRPCVAFGSIVFTVIICMVSAFAPVKAGAEELMLGFYSFADKAAIDALSGTSIQYVMPYGTDGTKEEKYLREYLDYAAGKKVKVIFSLKDVYLESQWHPAITWCPTGDEKAFIDCIIGKFGGHEAVAGWYFCDEPTNLFGRLKAGKLDANSRFIRANSAKPIFAEEVNPPKGKYWDRLAGDADFFMTAVYPVPDKPLSSVYPPIRDLKEKYDRPVIAVLQVFAKKNVPYFKMDGDAGRPPSYEEERAMSYLALLAGAKGIFYYSMFQLKKLDDWQERMKRLSELGDELKGNWPVIASTAKTLGSYGVRPDEGAYAELRNSGGKDYLFAVNSTQSAARVRLEGRDAGGKPVNKTVTLDKFGVKLMPIAEIN
ncbi:MAG: hypothetical protein HY894_09935 [Deltaproteobacteria bacterium]|nr:hypothetical protein [Deltaproteobacteria bacterium]